MDRQSGCIDLISVREIYRDEASLLLNRGIVLEALKEFCILQLCVDTLASFPPSVCLLTERWCWVNVASFLCLLTLDTGPPACFGSAPSPTTC